MMGTVSTRYAARSLWRNLRRTLLSVFGVAFGVGVGLIALAWIGGQEAMFIDAAAGGGVGHLRIAPAGWNERRSDELRLTQWEEVLERVRRTDGVEVATPRASVSGLLGLGTRSAHVELTGVDAGTEPRALRYVREVEEGRYLRRGERGAVVLGRAVAERLGAELDDELVVTVVDRDGEMQSALLRVVGLVRTGSRAIDATIAHVALEDVEALSGHAGAGQIVILVRDLQQLEALRTRLALGVPNGDEVLTWLDVAPELRATMRSRGASLTTATGIILLIVLLGVASAQLTGVLERRKELAVLAALGMPRVQVVRVVLTEGAILGVLSALIAFGWAGPLLHEWSTYGVDLSTAIDSQDDGLTFAGLLIDPVFHPSFGAWALPTALALSLIATLVASLYPAWFAARTDPASALRVDR